jgi:nicotinamidase-related amidase
MQEKLLPAMDGAAAVVRQHGILLQGARALKLSVLATEQYPKGLGVTVPELKPLLDPAATFEKTAFSCFGSAAFTYALAAGGAGGFAHETHETARQAGAGFTQIAVAGVETHVCVQQTVLDALARGLEVFLLADAVSSRSPANRETAIRLMRDAGAVVTSVESFLFDCLRDAAHPEFRTISRLVR